MPVETALNTMRAGKVIMSACLITGDRVIEPQIEPVFVYWFVQIWWPRSPTAKPRSRRPSWAR